jgi:endonuclease I
MHNIISVQFKSEMPQKSKSKRLLRSYKNFDNEYFIKDLNELNLDFSNFSDVNLAYNNFNHQFTEVYDKHVPLKKRSMVKYPVPYMNSKLRLKAVYKKRQLHNVFKTQRSFKSWEQYRKQRNIVTKIKIKSFRNYFLERLLAYKKNFFNE